MADDILFELLHSEIINYALEQSKDNIDKKVLYQYSSEANLTYFKA